MINHTFNHEKRRIIILALSLFLGLGLIYLGLSLFVAWQQQETQKQAILARETQLVETERLILSNRFSRLTTDLLYARDALILGNKAGDYTVAKENWLAFSDRKMIYDQIRYIAANGNELVRIDYDANGARIIPNDELQNKADRYYFTAAMGLAEDQIYVSPLDLNVEGDKVELPEKPMIRLAVPYFNASGTRLGVVVLNYTASDMLSQIETIASGAQGAVYLLNSDGYWLYNSENPESAFAFMYGNRLDQNFKNADPEAWAAISANPEGSVTTAAGVYHYSSVLTDSDFSLARNEKLALDTGDWKLVSFLPIDSAAGQLATRSLVETIPLVVKNNLPALVLIALISIFLALVLMINQVKNDEIRYYSEIDGLTGIYNRRAGYEKLKQLYKGIEKGNGPVSICFLDINGLKDVNDYLGHDVGDELITTITRVIGEQIRTNDFVARLGGDEFLIIFDGLTEEQAEAVWERIVTAFKTINESENRRYEISVSHGIEAIVAGSNDYIDSIINQADEKMYREKKRLKQDLQVVREQVAHEG